MGLRDPNGSLRRAGLVIAGTSFAANVLQYVGPIVLVLLVSMSGRMRTLVEPLLNLIR